MRALNRTQHSVYISTHSFFRVRYDARSEPRCNFPETSVSLFPQTHGNVNVKHRIYTSIYHLYCYVLCSIVYGLRRTHVVVGTIEIDASEICIVCANEPAKMNM